MMAQRQSGKKKRIGKPKSGRLAGHNISKAERQQNGVEANQQVAPDLGSLSPANLLHLQRSVGNQAVRRVVRQASAAPAGLIQRRNDIARAVVVMRLNDLATIGGPNGFDTVRAMIHAQYAKLDRDDAKLKKAADAYLRIFELAYRLLGGRNTADIPVEEKQRIFKRVERQLLKANGLVSKLSDPGLQKLEWNAMKILWVMGTVSTNASLIDEGLTLGLPSKSEKLAGDETRRVLLARFTEVLDGMIKGGEVDGAQRETLIRRYTAIVSSEGQEANRKYVGKEEKRLRIEILRLAEN